MLRSASSTVIYARQFIVILIPFVCVKPSNLFLLVIICFAVRRPPTGVAKPSDNEEVAYLFRKHVTSVQSWNLEGHGRCNAELYTNSLLLTSHCMN